MSKFNKNGQNLEGDQLEEWIKANIEEEEIPASKPKPEGKAKQSSQKKAGRKKSSRKKKANKKTNGGN